MKYLSIFILSFVPFLLFAQEKTFEREYTYKASELDSKISCRAITINQLRSLLLNEIGVYVESEQILKTSDVGGKFSQDFVENISTISAGITKLVVLGEKWNGETFWMKAAITIDPKSLKESLEQLVHDRQRVKELEDLKAQLADANKALAEITEEKSKQKDINDNDKTLQAKYNSKISLLNIGELTLNSNQKIHEQDYQGAIEIYNRIIEIEPSNWFAYSKRSSCQRELGNYSEAMKDINKTIELEPKDLLYLSYMARGMIKEDIKDFYGAIGDYSDALKADSSNHFYRDFKDKIYWLRGMSNIYIKDYREGIEDFTKAIALNPKNESAYSGRGLAKNGLQDYEGAIKDLTKAIELDPSDKEPYRERARAKFLMHQPDEAINDYTELIKIDHLDKDAINKRARLFFMTKKYSKAIDDFNLVLKMDPQDSMALGSRATIKFTIKDYTGAIVDYSSLIKLNNKNVHAYHWRGIAKSELNLKRQGIEDCSIALGIDPRNERIYFSLGNMKLESKDFRGAISDFNIALEINPNMSDAYYYRGLSLLYLDQKKEACGDFSVSSEMGFENAFEALRRFCQ